MRSWHPRLNDRKAWLLTAIDSFSKQVWVVPLADKRASTVATALNDQVLSNADRAPAVVQADRGSEFRSEAFAEVLLWPPESGTD